MNKKFEYFLNAVHYSLWIGDRKFGDFMGRIVDILLSPVPKYLFTKEYKKKYYKRLSEAQKTKEKFFYDKEKGYHLKYFKQFEKEDEQWHNKWKWITIVFCLGSIAFTIGGIFAMWGVSSLIRE